MAIPFHAVLARKHGKQEGYAVAVSFADSLPIRRKFDQLLADATFRAEHAEMQLIVDLNMIRQLRFPDPAIVEKQRKDIVAREAQEARTAIATAESKLSAAKEDHQRAITVLKSLTPEHKAVLKDLDAVDAARVKEEQAKAEASKQAENERAAAVAASEAKIQDGVAAAEKSASELPLV